MAPHPGAGRPCRPRGRSTSQVWTTSGWAKRLGLEALGEGVGYGHDSDQVAQVRCEADPLLEYYDEVHEATLRFVAGITGRRPRPGRGRALGSACDTRSTSRQRDLRRSPARRTGGLRPWHRRTRGAWLAAASPPRVSSTADSKRIVPVLVSRTKKTNGLSKVMGVDLSAAEATRHCGRSEATVPYFVTCKVAFCFTSLSWVASLRHPG